MNLICSDIIQLIIPFLNAPEQYALKRTCKYFCSLVRLHGSVEDEEMEILHSTIIYTQSWYFQNYTIPHKGRMCWTCGLICSSRNHLFKHLQSMNHCIDRHALLFDAFQLYYRIRSIQDVDCASGKCHCPSRHVDIRELFASTYVILHTRYGKITIRNVFSKGHISGLLMNNSRRYHYPCIYLNFLNIYIICDHYWISYYYSYDDRSQYQSLMIPIQKITFKESIFSESLSEIRCDSNNPIL